ncbi:MAG: hypothetical protein ACRCXK_10220 [Wohlfahrtiimonas sp.]
MSNEKQKYLNMIKNSIVRKVGHDEFQLGGDQTGISLILEATEIRESGAPNKIELIIFNTDYAEDDVYDELECRNGHLSFLFLGKGKWSGCEAAITLNHAKVLREYLDGFIKHVESKSHEQA